MEFLHLYIVVCEWQTLYISRTWLVWNGGCLDFITQFIQIQFDNLKAPLDLEKHPYYVVEHQT